MGKTVVIHQPDFLPYLGFFHRFLHSDLWVVLDHVQFLSGSKSWHKRDKIKTAHGAAWIGAAVSKCPQQTPINRVCLVEDLGWRTDCLNLIAHNYRHAPFFAEIYPSLVELFSYNCTYLSEFNMAGIRMLCSLFGITIETVFSSTLPVSGAKTELLVQICRAVEGTTYLSGKGAAAYLQPQAFEDAAIRVVWQDFIPPVYPQLHGEFISYLSSIDLLFNCGIDQSRTLLSTLKGIS